jgi:nitroimidazol reductase NimA-like FMN-containing flavoprotein (pyridoxamine 5'-phosphate oxidase superfamily)
MTVKLTSQQVWEVIEKNIFAVLGMVTKKNEARTVGINYVVRDRRLYIASSKDAWKVRHISNNPHVSLTIPVHKSVPLMPWIKIPPAAITFHGEAKILAPEDASQGILQALPHDVAENQEKLAGLYLIEVTPQKDFLTYGIGVSLLQMRDPAQARGRAPVDVEPQFVSEN